MYLRGSNWSMRHRRRRSNPFVIAALVVLVGVFVYIDRVIVPETGPLFIPTPTPTRDPESYIVEAESYYADGKINQAVESYKQSILVNPNNPANFVALARLQVLTGDYEGAVANAENALLLNPSNPLAHAVRGWALTFIEPVDYLMAEGALREAMDLDPNNPLIHAYYAEMLALQYEAGEGAPDTLERAIEESRKARDLNPNLLEVHRVRGYIYSLTQEYAEAVEEYKAAIAQNGNIADLHISLGLNYQALGDASEAINSFLRANSLNAKDPMASYYTSRTYHRMGEYAKAAQYAETALKVDPSSALLHGNMGSMYFKMEKYEDAIAHLRLAVRGGTTEDGIVVTGIPLSADRLTLEFYNRYGVSLARRNECGEAVQIAAAILDSVPNDEDSVYNAQVEMIQVCQENLENPPVEESGQETPTP
jgi:tetratricopeptide (TPR) repeat protein